MSSKLKEIVRDINSLIAEVRVYQNHKKVLVSELNNLKSIKGKISIDEYNKKLNKLLDGKSEGATINHYNAYISKLLEEIKLNIDLLTENIGGVKESKETVSSDFIPALDKQTKLNFLKELDIDLEYVKKYVLSKKVKKKKKIDLDKEFSVYSANYYGKLANRFFEPLTIYLINNKPELFTKLFVNLRASSIKVLSKTYVSIVLFSTLLGFIAVSIASLIYLLIFSQSFFLFSILKALVFGLIGGAISFAIAYSYPSSTSAARKKAIKNDLPFVIIHMSAVAGSGAQPTSIFDLILKSGEYKGVEREIKRIVNYINLFGYDLSTALRAVAITTPNKDFADLLNGLVSTIETGGDLKDYLKGKADDAMVNYRLERQKYVETLSTYSDVYTGILIAAPLLFFVTLAIIQMLGGSIGGLSVSTLAVGGTFLVIPALNIIFIVFMNMTQPD